MLEYPIRGDFALIKAHRADRMGNLVYRKTARNFGPVMATAATTTIAQVAEVVATGELDPEVVVTPGIYVDRVVPDRIEPTPTHRPRAAGPRRARRGWSPRDIPTGSFVNLGIGQPTLVADHLARRAAASSCTPRTACSAWAARPTGDEIDPDLINAGKIPVTETAGASYFHHADSFAMMRGGHLDVCVLGAFQVSVARRPGQLAHRRSRTRSPPSAARWTSPSAPSDVFVMMTLFARDGAAEAGARVHLPADRRRLRQPGLHRPRGVPDRADGVAVRETYGISLAELRSRVGLPLGGQDRQGG